MQQLYFVWSKLGEPVKKFIYGCLYFNMGSATRDDLSYNKAMEYWVCSWFAYLVIFPTCFAYFLARV